jgi:very-short-patch-repair endonuclease
VSEAEDLLGFQLKAVGVMFDRECRFDPSRRWRADFVIPSMHKSPLLIEIDGGTWTGGRHVTGSGHASDAEKRNAAVLLGYRPLTFSPAQVESGEALQTIEKALA